MMKKFILILILMTVVILNSPEIITMECHANEETL